MEDLKGAILKTLSYADVFDFPLKVGECYRFLITDKKIKEKTFEKALREIRKDGLIKIRKGWCFLKGREETINLRRRKEAWAGKKLKIAKKMARILKLVPFVKMVAVSGAVAMGNSKKGDDIDFLIVSKRGKVWTTRFLVTVLVEVFAERRRPGDKDVADKICLNMFLDEEHLAVPKRERDLFTAHEVVQLKPLWDKDSTYKKFLWENRWVRKCLPNAIPKNKKQRTKNKEQKGTILNLLSVICYLLSVICYLLSVEALLKHFQLFYMKKRRTTEVITDGIIRFHPKNARLWVLKEYQKRVNSVLR